MIYPRPSLCACVTEHQNFVNLPNGEKLKIDLILNSSLVRLNYIPDRDGTPHLLLDKGALTSASVAYYLDYVFYYTLVQYFQYFCAQNRHFSLAKLILVKPCILFVGPS